MAKGKDIVIGIDLGTRYAQLAVDLSGMGVQPIPNRWGFTRTPSMVAFSDGGLIAGEDAARLSLTDPRSAWWDMKRHLGTDWVARVGGRTYTPEELLIPLLSLLREDAEAHLRTFISSCVLAVPAHFSFPERGALARAAQSAGFEKVRIVNEPTAAALSVGTDSRFLILDFGAGTLDISVVEGENGVFQVVESKGRQDIGGYDIDKLLAEWLCKRAGIQFTRVSDPRGSLMMHEAEEVKTALSNARGVTWRVPVGLSQTESSADVTRDEFEALIKPLLNEIIGMVERMWKKHEPEKLLIVGGSSRIPMLREMLAKRVGKPERLKTSPDDAVVIGAAIYANQGSERLLIDVLSRSLGVMNDDGGVVQIMNRGTPLPAEAKRRFTASGSGSLEVTIVQGEGRVKTLNRVLQTVYVDNVQNGEVVDIFFRVDGGGLLHVEVKRKKKTSRQTISLDSDQSGVIPCDLITELSVREERIARLSMSFPDNFQQRLGILISNAKSLKEDDNSLQWQAVELIDKMIAEIEQVVSP
ncbi:heat-shock protein Hsp70 [Synergistales bacterium]|nr:heat-shock protein Hsp70 [Synergistales bacterium]